MSSENAREADVTLSLRYCSLTSLPEDISQLTHLQHLDVTGNELATLPLWLHQLEERGCMVLM